MEARKTLAPVEAWAAIVGDPETAKSYKSVRGRGGFVRATWDEVSEIIAAANVHTIKTWGPDRVVGFFVRASKVGRPYCLIQECSRSAGSCLTQILPAHHRVGVEP